MEPQSRKARLSPREGNPMGKKTAGWKLPGEGWEGECALREGYAQAKGGI